MKSDLLLEKIWRENALAVLARSHRLHDEIAESMRTDKPESAFLELARAHRLPLNNWQEAARHIWNLLKENFPEDQLEAERLFAGGEASGNQSARLAEIRLWLWRHVVRSGNQDLLASRFFAGDFLFHRTLEEDRLRLWYGDRQTEWPIQLLLALILGSHEGTQRLRLQLYWPAARLPENFTASRMENRALRRLWEARILVRFGTWAHLHPLIMLQLPEVSSFSSPVFEWRESRLLAHMADGRVWPLPAFALAALVFDESLALFGRDRRGWWRNFVEYASSFLRSPEDAASNFVLTCFDDLGLRAMREAEENFLREFTESVQFLEALRTAV